jgi:putative salt-induced outer membrane protein YdiY
MIIYSLTPHIDLFRSMHYLIYQVLKATSLTRTLEEQKMLPLKYKCFVLFLLMDVVSISAAWADLVVLKNGDRVTGSIVKKVDKNLTIQTDQFGVVVSPWDQIVSIVVEKPVNIILLDGSALQGAFTASEGKAEIVAHEGKTIVSMTDISTIRNDDEERAYQRMLHPRWRERWDGTGTTGLAGASGNAQTLTYTAGVKVKRVTNTDKTALYFNFIKASARVNDVSEDTAEAVRGGISYGHNINSRLFFDVFNDYEYDRFQDLDLRFVIGGGLGYQAVKTERHRLDLVAGAAYNRSSFSTPLIRKSGELYWGNEYALKLSSATSLVQSYRMFNDLTNTGEYRVNFDIGLNTKLLKWLTWNVSLSDRYLSNPVPGRKTNDLLYTTGLGIAFSN